MKYYLIVLLSLSLVNLYSAEATKRSYQEAIEDIPEDESPFYKSPQDIKFQLFLNLDILDIGRVAAVSKTLNTLLEKAEFWNMYGASFVNDYADQSMTKQRVINHMLKVKINTLSNKKEIERLIRKYKPHLEKIKFHFPLFILFKDLKFYNQENLALNLDKRVLWSLESYFQSSNECCSLPLYTYFLSSSLNGLSNLNEELIMEDEENAYFRKGISFFLGWLGQKKDKELGLEIINKKLNPNNISYFIKYLSFYKVGKACKNCSEGLSTLETTILSPIKNLDQPKKCDDEAIINLINDRIEDFLKKSPMQKEEEAELFNYIDSFGEMNRYVQYIKFYCLQLGIYGHKKDEAAANTYALKHSIAY